LRQINVAAAMSGEFHVWRNEAWSGTFQRGVIHDGNRSIARPISDPVMLIAHRIE
jgi:hypothetical protein